MKTLKFIALDLETTGLNPETDTIIEIAAIKGEIQQNNGTFTVINTEEKSMLINPGKPLEEEVILITKITEKMLEGRLKWQEIKEKVADFFNEDAVIIGHNVFFDIAMLKTHGIDLTNHKIIDTFEFAEIFSQNAQSLNLGFLADFYSIPKRGAEHRALTDTWISVDLLCKYLEIISHLDIIEKNIFQYILSENSPLNFLQIFFEKTHYNQEFLDWKNSQKIFPINQKTSKTIENISSKMNIISLENIHFSEIDLIKNSLTEHKKIKIFTRNKKSSENLYKRLEKENISTKINFHQYHFCANEEVLKALNDMSSYPRKYFIFLIKMAFWLSKTKTGLLGELKFYGEEYNFLHTFRLQKNENNIFYTQHTTELQNAECIIENWNPDTQKDDIFSLYKDISLTEETIRKICSQEISFEKLIGQIQKIPSQFQEKLIEGIRVLEAIYCNIPNRPLGENPIPPTKYGETYFFSQNDFWSGGCKWLSLGNAGLRNIFAEWKNETHQLSLRIHKIIREEIIKNIQMLFDFQTNSRENIGIIITIINDETSVRFVERNLNENMKKFWKNAIGYGFHLNAEGIENFIHREIGDDVIFPQNKENGPKITQFQNMKNISLKGKTLILTTSMKHIREIGSQLEGQIDTLLLQGTSGGKSKMTHYFLEENKNSVLIGLIDSWIDEEIIFEKIDRILIAKIPFDPPTDSHFLAKTQGMSHSFEMYSKPIVLSRLNTLIGNIFSVNPKVQIFCTDERIFTTEWGKFVGNNLF